MGRRRRGGVGRGEGRRGRCGGVGGGGGGGGSGEGGGWGGRRWGVMGGVEGGEGRVMLWREERHSGGGVGSTEVGKDGQRNLAGRIADPDGRSLDEMGKRPGHAFEII